MRAIRERVVIEPRPQRVHTVTSNERFRHHILRLGDVRPSQDALSHTERQQTVGLYKCDAVCRRSPISPSLPFRVLVGRLGHDCEHKLGCMSPIRHGTDLYAPVRRCSTVLLR